MDIAIARLALSGLLFRCNPRQHGVQLPVHGAQLPVHGAQLPMHRVLLSLKRAQLFGQLAACTHAPASAPASASA
eukprot:CAMPEP_0182546686 /NCGR_PEP_ID=MMETSP1323-20130603/36377_1 /TAXON_ID=236787 /ORGANISM="Florenciella parvula, Strain RCC1693" /LENGTH=74 /DNA_ID=CAMNT_0024757937 /DNA_START=118 /DNA_END=339 /DNA_ORIENTATION=+